MTNEDQHWSYDDDIPDGTDWEEILSDLRWLARQCITRSDNIYGLLEWTLLNADQGYIDREHLLKIVREGQERSKPLTTYLNKINEYILRRREMRDKDEPET